MDPLTAYALGVLTWLAPLSVRWIARERAWQRRPIKYTETGERIECAEEGGQYR